MIFTSIYHLDISSLQSRPTSSSLSRYSVLPEINNHGEKIFTPYLLPDQPPTGGLHIAIKLLDGSRIQRTFSYDDRLLDLLKFASNSTNEDMSSYELFNPLNRGTLKDLSASLKDIGILDKTTLFIQIPD